MRSQNAKEMLKLLGNQLLSALVASTSCLITIVETEDHEEMMNLLEVVKSLSVAKMFVLLIVSTFVPKKIVNLTINFKVMVHHKESGMKVMKFCISREKCIC